MATAAIFSGRGSRLGSTQVTDCRVVDCRVVPPRNDGRGEVSMGCGSIHCGVEQICKAGVEAMRMMRVLFFSLLISVFLPMMAQGEPQLGGVAKHQAFLDLGTDLRLMCVAAHPDNSPSHYEIL